MAYIIDAWLDCPKPYLKVLNSISGREVLNFDRKELDHLLESGEICLTELMTNDQQVLEEVVRQLALYSCRKELYKKAFLRC
ncbi:hypothetical protein QKW35_04655 [Pontibacterium granulatum]|uniref:hypothetical protein n=1 Tax=Pontibacterium granulatum TaxID=2036029 RepID=UPI00249A98D0|nr:hypothetical protein [Pontibacterium granulatum]MDI3323662.1 hypothetical protein [Pontibacterium granulatum]